MFTNDAMMQHPRTPGTFWSVIGWEAAKVGYHDPVHGYGPALARMRHEAGLSQQALAMLIGTHASDVNGWEHGHRPIPRKYVERIEDACGAPFLPTHEAA